MRYKIIFSFLSIFLSYFFVKAQKNLPITLRSGVTFKTTDKGLQQLYDMAERKILSNIKDFDNYKVLVEGAGYPHVWLETQPMGGEMYAKRNIPIAKTNQVIFMDHQRADGKLPGMMSFVDNKLRAHYGWLQGFCFPEPALNVYYWLNKDTQYLKKLYNTLDRFDQYLWKTRDSDGDGCLETWCVWDTGEDYSVRLDGAPLEWTHEFAPSKAMITKYPTEIQGEDKKHVLSVPMESMDIMSYSYSAREVLSKIAKILNNGKASYWQDKAQQVRNKIKSYLWDPVQLACYDRDPENKKVNILLSNNIRCMYYGSFDQQMADAFIQKHLLNPKEFWTPMPLPSIAVNDPAFKNIENNNWSGQPQGLTFQRAIRALENYGHYAEVTLVGNRLINTLRQNLKFTQQYDPFTKHANNSPDGYGPTILSLLEYISRMQGIHYENDMIMWSGLTSANDSTRYEQVINSNKYLLQVNKNTMSAFVNDKPVFTSSANTRCITDANGKFLKIVGIDTVDRSIKLNLPRLKQLGVNVKPNNVYKLSRNNKIVLDSSAPFDYKK